MDLSSAVDLLPPVSAGLVGLLAAALLVLSVLARRAAGKPIAIARRPGLFVIRALVIAVLLAILANPVRRDESPGDIERPKVFYLLDASESMALGDEVSRFDKATQTIREAWRLTPEDARPRLSVYRFGRKLSAIESSKWLDSESGLTPSDSDTQLQFALRQLAGRFGPKAPASVVLFSDGRAREASGVEDIARRYAAMKAPIHVMPFGGAARGGDVAIVNMVVPRRVRKHSEVGVQVFVRSYGYDGRRSELRLQSVRSDGSIERQFNALPISLHDGVQSFHLSFQSEMDPVRVQAAIDLQPDEVASNNNTFTADVAIDRTKIRVLCVVQGRGATQYAVRNGVRQIRYSGAYLNDAFSKDPDIACNVFHASSGVVRYVSPGVRTPVAFPTTSAELFAYDAIVLANVSRSEFDDELLGQIDKSIRERGAGLCMIGGPNSFASGGWRRTPVEDMLPVAMRPSGGDWRPSETPSIQPNLSGRLHPLWRITSDEKQNLAILGSLPDGSGVNRIVGPKTIATVLAAEEPLKRDQAPAPMVAVAPYGKGRTMAIMTRFSDRPDGGYSRSWGEADNRYYEKFWLNAVYWLTENSAIGRRRLFASADKLLYRPGETIEIRAATYDESASRTTNYRVEAMIEPQSITSDLESDYCDACWPDSVQRTSGEENPRIAWGEMLEIPFVAEDKEFAVSLPISEELTSGIAGQALRLELSAYEDFALIDSTSIDVQILDDPVERQNPIPNPELLRRVAAVSGGKELSDAESLAAMIEDLPSRRGPSVVSRTPLWSRWWLLSVLLVLLTVDWAWRRILGLA